MTAPRCRFRGVLPRVAAILLVVPAASCGAGSKPSSAQAAAESVRAHPLYATDPPRALQTQTVKVGSFRDLLENRTVDGYIQKRYYSSADPLEATLDVVRHARPVGASIAKIDCTEKTAGVSGSFMAAGIRQGFGAGASVPVQGGDILETGMTKAPPEARSFVTIQTTPYAEPPGGPLQSSTTIVCPADRLSDDVVRTLLGTKTFVRTTA